MDTQYKTSKFLRDLTKIYRKTALLLFSHQVSNLICILNTKANKVPKFSSEAQNCSALRDSAFFPTGQIWVHVPLMPLLRYVSSGKLFLRIIVIFTPFHSFLFHFPIYNLYFLFCLEGRIPEWFNMHSK